MVQLREGLRAELFAACEKALERARGQEIVLVFGATGDVGQAFVHEFVEREKFVIAIARDQAKLAELKKAVCGDNRSRYSNFGYVSMDAADLAACDYFAELCHNYMTHVPVVVFAAGGLKVDQEFGRILASTDWHRRANYKTRTVPYAALQKWNLLAKNSLVLVVGSAASEWPPEDSRLENEVGYATSFRYVEEWCKVVEQNHMVGHLRYLPYPLMQGTIANHLIDRRVVPQDLKLPTAVEEVRSTTVELVLMNIL